MRREFLLAVLAVGLFATQAFAASIGYVGADVTTNDAWRTTTLAKALDGDADNVYGTDGWEARSWAASFSHPAYATVAINAPSSYPGNASYAYLDNPAATGPAPVANIVSGVHYYGGAGEQDFYTATLTQAVDFRLGIITDNTDFAAISPSSLRVRQTVGGGANSGLISAAADRDNDGDYYFFDVTGGQVGDAFVVSGVQDGGHGSNGLAGITFDQSSGIPVTTIARLRANYDAHTPVSGETSIGKIADTHGSGSWNFYRAGTVGGALTPQNYGSCGLNPAVNGYRDQTHSGNYYLAAIANQDVVGNEGTISANQLSTHPGPSDLSYLVARWTAGVDSAGTFNFLGSHADVGAAGGNGTTFEILHNGATVFGSTVVTNTIPAPFNLDLAITAGDTVDFYIGNNGSYGGDHSGLEVTITGEPVPEPSGFLLATVGLLGMLAFGRRKRLRM